MSLCWGVCLSDSQIMVSNHQTFVRQTDIRLSSVQKVFKHISNQIMVMTTTTTVNNHTQAWRLCSSGLAIFVIVAQAILLILTNLPEPVEVDCKGVASSPFQNYKEHEAELFGANATGSSSSTHTNSTTPISKSLPKRLLTVFGLESSGTTFVTSLLEKSTGVEQRKIDKGRLDRGSKIPWRDYELQHMSLPSGLWCEAGGIHEVVPALYPSVCIRMHPGTAVAKTPEAMERFRQALSRDCRATGFVNDGKDYIYPKRFFVNITSHIQWYRDHGVEASAVLVVRDKSIGAMARSFVHCALPQEREEEEALGMKIMREAMQVFQGNLEDNSAPALVLLSYETLLNVGLPYLNQVLHQLHLPPLRTADVPNLKDGNKRYIQSRDEVARLEKEREEARKKNLIKPKNPVPPTNRKEQAHYVTDVEVEASDEKEG